MKMYHATYASYLSSILERGLGALTPHKNWSQSVRGVVYLSSNPDCAIDMAESSEMVPDVIYNSGIILLSIDCSGLYLVPDRNIQDAPADIYYEFHGIIPPDRLTVCKETKYNKRNVKNDYPKS